VNRDIPAATVARLPVYLRSLGDLAATETTCSSDRLAEIAGVNPAQVRKDLSHLGTHGTRGVGYNIADLLGQLRTALGLTHGYQVAIVGDHPPEKITYKDVDDFIEVQAARRLKAATINRRLAAVVSLYNNKLVWRHFGYEGASAPLGGYIKRGFDDLTWLPEPDDAASPPAA